MSGKKPIATTQENLNAAEVQKKIEELQIPNLNSLITQLIIKHIKKSGTTGKDTYLSLENLTQKFPDTTPANQLKFFDSLKPCVSKIIKAKNSKKNPLLDDEEITRYTQGINTALGRGSHGFAISYRALASLLNTLGALNDDKLFEFILQEMLNDYEFLPKFQEQKTPRAQKECLDEFIKKITKKYQEYEQAQQVLETSQLKQQQEDSQKLNDILTKETEARISNQQDELQEQNNIDEQFIIETEKLTRKNAEEKFLEEQKKIIEQLELEKQSILAKQALDQTKNNQDNLDNLISEENLVRTITQQEALKQQEELFRQFSINKEPLERSSIEQKIAQIKQEIQNLDQIKTNILNEETDNRTKVFTEEYTEFTNQINQFNLLNEEQQQRYKIAEETQQILQNNLTGLEGLLRTSIQTDEQKLFAEITSLSNLEKTQTEQTIQLKNLDKLLREIIETITTANISTNYTDPEHKAAIDTLNTCIDKINAINNILNKPSNLQHIAYTDFQGFNTQYLTISGQIKLLLDQNISPNQELKTQAITELTNLLEKIKTYTVEQRKKELLKEMVAKEITHLIYEDLHKNPLSKESAKKNIGDFTVNLIANFKAKKDALSTTDPNNITKDQENLIKQVFLLKCLGCNNLSDFVNLNDPIKGWFSTTAPEPTETYVSMFFDQLSSMVKQANCNFLFERSRLLTLLNRPSPDSELIEQLQGTKKDHLTTLLKTNNIPDKLQAIKSASSTLIGVLSKLQDISKTKQSASWQPELIDLELEQFSVATTLEAYKSDNLLKIDYTITENLKKLSAQNDIDKQAYEQLQKLLKPQIELAKQKENSANLANDLIKIIKEVHELKTKEYNNNTSEISNSLIKLSNDLPHKLARII